LLEELDLATWPVILFFQFTLVSFAGKRLLALFG